MTVIVLLTDAFQQLYSHLEGLEVNSSCATWHQWLNCNLHETDRLQPLCPPRSINLSKINCLIILWKKYADSKYQALPTSSPSWLSLSSFMPLPSSLYLLPLKFLLDCWNGHLGLVIFLWFYSLPLRPKSSPDEKTDLAAALRIRGGCFWCSCSVSSFSEFFLSTSFSFIDAQSLCWMTSLVTLVMFWT